LKICTLTATTVMATVVTAAFVGIVSATTAAADQAVDPSTQGLNPATLAQGQKTTGKVYFDVTGDQPSAVVYVAAGQELASWVPSPAPQPRSGSPTTTAAASGPVTTPTPTATAAVAAGQQPPAASSATPAPAGSQGSAGSPATPTPSSNPATPTP
jgi:hypothetical protein